MAMMVAQLQSAGTMLSTVWILHHVVGMSRTAENTLAMKSAQNGSRICHDSNTTYLHQLMLST